MQLVSCNLKSLFILSSIRVDSCEDEEMEREWSVLCGVIEHLLPRVGDHVRTLDLAYGKAVTNEVVSWSSIIVYNSM